MIDVKQALRTAYFKTLDGKLTYNGQPVPVSDDLKPPASGAAIYVILSGQNGVERNTFSSWASDETINLDIIAKSSTRASKEPLDQVAGQILALICPFVDKTGLTPQPGIQINCVRLDSDRYLSLSLNSSNSVDRRILTFKQYVAQI